MEEPHEDTPHRGVISLALIPRFLLGASDAIAAVANNRSMLWLGGLFCLSAGFAREYDGDDLLHEPWHLVIPLGASLSTSLLLYALLHLAILRRTDPPPSFGANYVRFLSVYWMTAPLAWLYAIPVEQFLSQADAMRANLWLLAVVAAWRVALITRCASVLLGARAVAVTPLVMLFADTLVQVILMFTPLPLFNIMGGIRLTEAESLILNTAFLVRFVGMLTLPIWVVGSLVVLAKSEPQWKPLSYNEGRCARTSRLLWTLAAVSLLAWAFVLPYSQPPQQLKRLVELRLTQGNLPDALGLMGEHDRKAFPAGWDPPPWPGYGVDEPPLNQILIEIIDSDHHGWVRELFVAKFLRVIYLDHGGAYFWRTLEDNELRDYAKIFRALPETLPTKHDPTQGVSDTLEYYADEMSEERKALYHDLLAAMSGDNGSHTDEEPTH